MRQSRTIRIWAAAALFTVALAGCSSAAEPEAQPPPASQAPTASVAAGDTTLLSEQGLDGLTARQIVEKLDATNEDRDSGLAASIRPQDLQLTEGARQVTMPVERFYLSIAPFRQQTHECFDHSLTGCQGEMVGQDVKVKITGQDGTVYVDEAATTMDNGFVGFWLPRNVNGTVEITHEGASGSMPFATNDDSPTCMTTLRLT